MHLHEYQTKLLFQKRGIPTPPFYVLNSLDQLRDSPFDKAVVKVQVHAGGRGKAGGIRFAKNRKEMAQAAQDLLGMRIINNQTGPEGLVSHTLLLTEPVNIKKEYYIAFFIDRTLGMPTLLASSEGGMDIEEIAHKKPESILKEPFDRKFYHFQLINICKKLGLNQEGAALIQKLAKLFLEEEALLLEINPLVLTEEGELLCLDAKCSIDENALFRHPALKALEDLSQISENERLAKESELAYVGLNGNIGCMVNGAGLAMATMDILHYYGGEPANFLDVGGSASFEKIALSFNIIQRDPKVKAIFVNIFGGIMDCALIAEGIVAQAKENPLTHPLIVRLEGTNVERGIEILQNVPHYFCTTLEEGAQLAVAKAK